MSTEKNTVRISINLSGLDKFEAKLKEVGELSASLAERIAELKQIELEMDTETEINDQS